MKRMDLMKESYERSSLTITSFTQEDVITTSGEIDLSDFNGDNNSQPIVQTQ